VRWMAGRAHPVHVVDEVAEVSFVIHLAVLHGCRTKNRNHVCRLNGVMTQCSVLAWPHVQNWPALSYYKPSDMARISSSKELKDLKIDSRNKNLASLAIFEDGRTSYFVCLKLDPPIQSFSQHSFGFFHIPISCSQVPETTSFKYRQNFQTRIR
jgi:hypothetical protein